MEVGTFKMTPRPAAKDAVEHHELVLVPGDHVWVRRVAVQPLDDHLGVGRVAASGTEAPNM
jgi:hypothetical protein